MIPCRPAFPPSIKETFAAKEGSCCPNNHMRIALFTPFSPEIGGGSVQFRSLLPELRDLDIVWFYLAEKPAGSQPAQWLGRPFTTKQLLSDLCLRSGFLPGSTALARAFASRIQADLYWVVAHNEGISLATELCAMGKRVHLTIHDDPVCMFKRSRKYRAFAPLMSRQFSGLLQLVESVDVISPGMRDAYKQRYKLNSFPVYRFVSELPRVSSELAPDTLTVGHIGSVYQAEPFCRFLSACQQVSRRAKRVLKVVRIGSSPDIDQLASANPQVFENCGEQNEEKAIARLASCDFLYAMYPAGRRFQCFRQTSLPMKLSTYIQAQRPIFAHTPSDSSLATIVEKYKIGTVCTSNDESELHNALKALLEKQIPRARFEEVRLDLMGPEPLQQLRATLMNVALNPTARSSAASSSSA